MIRNKIYYLVLLLEKRHGGTKAQILHHDKHVFLFDDQHIIYR